jgi:YidC/Oxa1 family membrane protein insertase
MMVIAIVPAFFLKSSKPAATPSAVAADSTRRAADSTARTADSVARAAAPGVSPAANPAQAAGAPAAPAPVKGDTIVARSPIYEYGVNTLGARVVQATLRNYKSMAPGDSGRPAQIVPPGEGLLGLTLVRGRDTLPLERWPFTPSPATRTLDVRTPTPLRFHTEQNGITVDLTYTFLPDDYRIAVSGNVTGLGPTGGLLLVSLNHGIRNTEADSVENARSAGLVTKPKRDAAHRTDFTSLKPGQVEIQSGPFDWVAVKTKYFVTAILAFDSTAGSIAGVSAQALPSPSGKPTAAEVKASLTVPPSGRFSYQLYAGPMEYQHLSRIGHEFDDVNPYGWPGFRTLIRFFAVPVRWLLVAMHDQLHLSYGLVLVVFGLLIRVLLWPLNQKAMRSSMAMQALQPRLKELQARYKDNPQQQQKEMFALYKEYKVNPLGGCWPMLLPWPVLLALFFVFQNSIELRGASFLWVPDLSRPDPLYIIPIVMGLSMYVLTKVGQKGMEPNPQMQMTMYIMPAMMTFIFLRFAAGLNLYYTISNLASIPQQWLLARERMRRGARAIVEVKTKPPKTR